MRTTDKSKNHLLKILSLRDFRLLFVGASTSLLGDQFALIAIPWLVLKLTGDPLALGFVLALVGIPRAAFMLLGGVFTDRLSPRIIMLISDIIRFFLTGMMAIVIFTEIVQLWMLYAFALGFGLVAGFAVPAENSIVPRLVKGQDLQAGNSIMMGITQMVGFIGPTVAGILIGGISSSSIGIGLAFAIDAFSFGISSFCFWMIHIGNRHQSFEESIEKVSVWASILIGIKYLWSDRALRLMILVLTAVNFLVIGPILVGIPVLADQRLPEGAVAFGLLMSGSSGGNLAGIFLAGSLPRPNGSAMRFIMITVLVVFGVVIGSLGFISSTWMDFCLMLLLGIGNGYISIIFFTWIQTYTPKEMLGRMMSLLMFFITGLVPVSQAISGAISKWDLNFLFVSAGSLLLLVTLWATFQPGFKIFSENLSMEQPGNLNKNIITNEL